MANHIAAARRRAEISSRYPAATPAPSPEPFTDADWKCAQIAREAADSIHHIFRWRVTVVASDGFPRDFFLLGRLENVERRAALIFGFHTHVVAIEPAANGREVYSRQLNLSGEP